MEINICHIYYNFPNNASVFVSFTENGFASQLQSKFEFIISKINKSENIFSAITIFKIFKWNKQNIKLYYYLNKI